MTESPAVNYAFDVTPSRLVTGLITERGICEASDPYEFQIIKVGLRNEQKCISKTDINSSNWNICIAVSYSIIRNKKSTEHYIYNGRSMAGRLYWCRRQRLDLYT